MTTNTLPTGPLSRLAPMIHEDMKQLKASSSWFLILGGALIVLGCFALAYSAVATIASVEVFGFVLIVGAAMYFGGALFTGSWGGFFLTLMMGVLQLAAGAVCVRHPAEAAIVYTLLMAVFLMVSGLFRIVTALTGRFRAWGWVLVNGLITLMLGIMIWQQMPFSGLWVIGTFLGVDLVFSGWSYVSLGLGLRKLPTPA